jgi:hypothetical protein
MCAHGRRRLLLPLLSPLLSAQPRSSGGKPTRTAGRAVRQRIEGGVGARLESSSYA